MSVIISSAQGVDQFGNPVTRVREVGMAIFRTRNDTSPIVFDAVLETPVTAESTVTDYPVEDGSDASDHVIRKPRRVSFRAVVTNTLNDPEAARQLSQTGPGGADNPTGVLQRVANAHVRAQRVRDVLLELKQLRFSGEPVASVATSYETIQNAQLIAFSHREIGLEAIEISGTFRELFIASTRRVPLPAPEVEDQAKPKKNLGKVTPKQASEEQKDTSLFHLGFGHNAGVIAGAVRRAAAFIGLGG